MSLPSTPENVQVAPVKTEDEIKKEANLVNLRKKLENEERTRQKLEREIEELKSRSSKPVSVSADEDDYDEPYIDKRYLSKQLDKERERIAQEAERRVEAKIKKQLYDEKVNSWLKVNPDFEEVMSYAQKFAESDPELAETILEMPEGFERQKLVYKNIKALGLHKPKVESSVQEKIDKNRRTPYYQPTGSASAPYGISHGGKSYSPQEGKSALDYVNSLKARIGGIQR